MDGGQQSFFNQHQKKIVEQSLKNSLKITTMIQYWKTHSKNLPGIN